MSPGRGLSWRYSRYQPDHCRAGRLAPQGAGCEHYMGSGSGMPPRLKRRLSYPVGGHARSILASSADLAVWAGTGLFGIADLIDVPAGVTDWRMYYGLVPHLFLEQGAGHGGVDGDVILALEDLVIADDAKALGLSLLIFHLDPGTEKDLALLGGGVVDDPQLLEALAQVTDAPVDLPQPFLVVLVL